MAIPTSTAAWVNGVVQVRRRRERLLFGVRPDGQRRRHVRRRAGRQSARTTYYGDLNGDGVPDLITNNANGGFTVQLGNGKGAFTTASTFSAPASFVLDAGNTLTGSQIPRSLQRMLSQTSTATVKPTSSSSKAIFRTRTPQAPPSSATTAARLCSPPSPMATAPSRRPSGTASRRLHPPRASTTASRSAACRSPTLIRMARTT